MHKFLMITAALALSTPVLADESVTFDKPTATRNEASGIATDRGSISKDLGGGTSIGVESRTTTSGGYKEGGSGLAIPDNTRDSRQDTSRGVFIEKRF
jgi:hypothetical protein